MSCSQGYFVGVAFAWEVIPLGCSLRQLNLILYFCLTATFFYLLFSYTTLLLDARLIHFFLHFLTKLLSYQPSAFSLPFTFHGSIYLTIITNDVKFISSSLKSVTQYIYIEVEINIRLKIYL